MLLWYVYVGVFNPFGRLLLSWRHLTYLCNLLIQFCECKVYTQQIDIFFLLFYLWNEVITEMLSWSTYTWLRDGAAISKLATFKFISRIDILSIACEIALRWMPKDLADCYSTLIQVMAWCRQATSHYLNQCSPNYMTPHATTRPQCVIWI